MPRASNILSLLSAGLILAGAAVAAPESLLKNSPFGPAGGGPEKPGQSESRLELRGAVSEEGVTSYSIYDTATKMGAWLRLNEVRNGVRLLAHDPAANAVTVEVEGHALRLVMKKAQIVTMVTPVSTAPAGAMATGMRPGGVPGQPGIGPGPAQPPSEQEIAERRKRVLEEISRRRALRAGQAAPAPGQPPASAPAQP